MGVYILLGLVALSGYLVQSRLKSKFKTYSKIILQNGLSGREIAEKMLADNGITDVKVVSTSGKLTDHYNPVKKTVNLSQSVYNQVNAAAAAVAAHECGHAVQHAKGYSWLKFRSNMVPVLQFSGNFINIILIAGVLLIQIFPSLLLIGILLFFLTVVFSLVTLPVEYDASRRALVWLDSKNMVTQQEYEGAKDALAWAARTYVVAAISSIITLLYYVMIYLNRR